MIFTSTISLILALAPATLFAAPTQVGDSTAQVLPRQETPAWLLEQLKQNEGFCDVSKVKLPKSPTPLPAVGEGFNLRHIAIGRGTQNYTCASSTADAVPVANGAIATLFNATCDYVATNENMMADFTALALKYPIPTGEGFADRISGHHYFTDQKVPMFDLKTARTNYGWVQAKPDSVKSLPPSGASPGTNNLGSVAWLKLNSVGGDYKEVYRVHTAGGMAPKTCAGQKPAFEIEYSAQYWFYA